MSDSNVTPPGNSPTPASPTPPPYTGSAPQAPAYQTPAYPTQAPPAYGTPAPGYAAPKTNVLAIISMIASILGFIMILPVIGSLAGAIMGHISLNQLKSSGENGRGMALTGVILGWIGLALAVIGLISFLAFVTWASQQNFQTY
ncbi:DUF4190 domain-containing protein [Microbacterium sp.]|uniref:DUF4190 domain-containing protein n=1 Tax=Microbacterium sp. TaxID=51671 RepID=UPI003A8859E9